MPGSRHTDVGRAIGHKLSRLNGIALNQICLVSCWLETPFPPDFSIRRQHGLDLLAWSSSSGYVRLFKFNYN